MPVQIFYEDLSEVKINKHAAFIAGKSSLPKPARAVHFFLAAPLTMTRNQDSYWMSFSVFTQGALGLGSEAVSMTSFWYSQAKSH